MKFLAFTYPGLETILKKELQNRKIMINNVSDGFVCFEGDISTMVKTNLWLRTASKIYIILEEIENIENFDQLFESVYSIDRKSYISPDFSITVQANSHKSKIFSNPTIQSITHKAILKKLIGDKFHKPTKFGNNEIRIEIYKNQLKVLLNTSGESLYKRGYKNENSLAGLKETLTSGIILLSGVGDNLYDCFCGSGTILIEKAMIELNIAPGLKRKFAFENFPWFDENILEKEIWRAKTREKNKKFLLKGTDIDPNMISIASENAQNAGVSDFIDFSRMNFEKISNNQKHDILTNPPYNKRLKLENIDEIYSKLENIFLQNDIKGGIITGYDEFKFDSSWKFRTLSNGGDLVRFLYRI